MKHAGSGAGRRRWFRKGGGTAEETPTVDVAARLSIVGEHRHAVAAARAGAAATDAPGAAEPAEDVVDLAAPVATPAGETAAVQTAAAPGAAPLASPSVADLTPEQLDAARAELERLMAEYRGASSAADAPAAPSVDAALPETPWWVAVDEDEAVLSRLDVAPEQLDELVLVHQEPAGDADVVAAATGSAESAAEQAQQPSVVAEERVVDLSEPAAADDEGSPWYASLRSDADLPSDEPQDAAIDLRATSDDPGDVLARLLRLREAGLLSADEYEQERRALAERA